MSRFQTSDWSKSRRAEEEGPWQAARLVLALALALVLALILTLSHSRSSRSRSLVYSTILHTHNINSFLHLRAGAPCLAVLAELLDDNAASRCLAETSGAPRPSASSITTLQVSPQRVDKTTLHCIGRLDYSERHVNLEVGQAAAPTAIFSRRSCSLFGSHRTAPHRTTPHRR
jgi:hypothetical protein